MLYDLLVLFASGIPSLGRSPLSIRCCTMRVIPIHSCELSLDRLKLSGEK